MKAWLQMPILRCCLFWILNQKTDFPFHGRNRRPPKDAVNAMLSFAYTLIANDTSAALETVGLDPYVGFLHTLRPGRTSLGLGYDGRITSLSWRPFYLVVD